MPSSNLTRFLGAGTSSSIFSWFSSSIVGGYSFSLLLRNGNSISLNASLVIPVVNSSSLVIVGIVESTFVVLK